MNQPPSIFFKVVRLPFLLIGVEKGSGARSPASALISSLQFKFLLFRQSSVIGLKV